MHSIMKVRTLIQHSSIYCASFSTLSNENSNIKINSSRLLNDLKELRTIGSAGVGNGVIRPALTLDDIKAREWLMEKMSAAGLEPSMDRIGNVLGRSRQSKSGRLLIGSHTDTQLTGGWLDGALGVIYALEAVRAIQEANPTEEAPLCDVVSWQDEEGRFGSLVGSRSFLGDLISMDSPCSLYGGTFGDAITKAGLNEKPLLTLDLNNNPYKGYFEAHIEQGQKLELNNLQIGVVSAIVGLRELQITFTGHQNHAGTTMMRDRKDAGMSAILLANEINQRFSELAKGRDTVWTFGHIKFLPGAGSIVPGHATLLLQFRDIDIEVLDRMEEELHKIVAKASNNLSVEVNLKEARDPVAPVEMDKSMRKIILDAGKKECPEKCIEMGSGAIHDASPLSSVMPAAMLFVPSIGGISHNFSEDTDEIDIIAGAQVFAVASKKMLDQL